MVLIRKIKYALCILLLANVFAVNALADDYYTYGSTAFNGFAAESYGSYVFAVGTDNRVHAWDVSIPAGADPNDRNYGGFGSPAPRTFTHLGSFSLGYSNQFPQASLYVSDNTLWYGSGQDVTLTESSIPTTGLRAYDWGFDTITGDLVGTRDESEDVIFDEDMNDGNDETVEDSETLAYDETTDTWYIGTSDGRIFHLDDNNDWIEDFTHLDMGGNQAGIEIVDGLLVIADGTNDVIAIYENQGSVAAPDWQLTDKDGDGVRGELEDVYTYTNNEEVNGLGYGQFDHLWVIGDQEIYELGAGPLQPVQQLVPLQLRIAVHEPASGLLFMSSLVMFAYFRRRKLDK